ncbi:MAG: transcriptional regulator, partial [Planktomarina sp.]
SKRLAHASQALVQYLDTESDTQGEIRSPQDEVEDILTGFDFHLADLEQGDDVGDVVQRAFSQVTSAAMELAAKFCVSYDVDRRTLPLQKLMDAVDQIGLHPAKLAQYLAVSFPLVLRRLASLPRDPRWPDMGLVVCDSSGSLIQKKACAGFSLPRVGAGCVLWPLFTALHQPSVPIHRVIEHQGRPGDQMGPGPAPTFDSYSIAIPRPANDLGAPVVFESTMLVVPRADDDQGAGGAQHVGATCRICSKTDCVARREPNVLSDGF